MQWYDWLIVLIPTALVFYMGWTAKSYVKGVADFLSMGRVCGRYVMCVADVANALSIIGLVAYIEAQYKAGFALTFWQNIMLPLSILLSLTGYVYFRFRETKAMSIGQFLEMRYSRSLRIFAAALRSISEIFANMIMPAVGARFFIYMLDLPQTFNFCGLQVPTFMVLLLIILAMALALICLGGSLAITITDAIQGMVCYPLVTLFIVYVLWNYPWSSEVVPTMSDRVAGQSFINPYDLASLRDFNLFSLVVAIFVLFIHRGSWIVTSGAKSAHEHKMAGVLGAWRGTFNILLYVVITIAVIVTLNHKNHAEVARTIRLEVSSKVADEIIADKNVRDAVIANIKKIPPHNHTIGVDKPLSHEENLDTPYLQTVHKTLQENNVADANAKYQEFNTLYHQLTLPMVMRNILPGGMMGLFCLLMLLAMLSTDDTRIFSAALTVAQDVVLPLCPRQLSPKEHIMMVRIVALSIGVVFFCGSYFMAQLDYINLFVTIVASMWMGGCGPVIIFGLYSRFGTTQGAWTSLLTGLFLAGLGIFLQRNWADLVYPAMQSWGIVDSVGAVLAAISRPFNPYIVWEMNPVKCPINAYEFYFINMLITLALYCVVSKLTCKEPFNLDRMLHRGKYSLDGEIKTTLSWAPKNILAKLVGITPEYTRGDKFIAWGFFFYSFVYNFVIAFVLVVIWNAFMPWPIEWWGHYFLVVTVVIPGIMTVISMVWFMIGGIIDLRKLFRDLAARKANDLDNGQVEGNMSLADKAELESLDKE